MEESRRQVADDCSPQTPDEFIAQERAMSEKVLTFGIYRDNHLGGYVRVCVQNPWMCEAHCVFSRDFFGYQTTIPALNEVARQLFENGIERITMPIFAHNSAIKGLIKKLGAVEEGRLRECTRQNGRPVDLIVFGLLKREWEAKQNPAPKLDDKQCQQQVQL